MQQQIPGLRPNSTPCSCNVHFLFLFHNVILVLSQEDKGAESTATKLGHSLQVSLGLLDALSSMSCPYRAPRPLHVLASASASLSCFPSDVAGLRAGRPLAYDLAIIRLHIMRDGAATVTLLSSTGP